MSRAIHPITTPVKNDRRDQCRHKGQCEQHDDRHEERQSHIPPLPPASEARDTANVPTAKRTPEPTTTGRSQCRVRMRNADTAHPMANRRRSGRLPILANSARIADPHSTPDSVRPAVAASRMRSGQSRPTGAARSRWMMSAAAVAIGVPTTTAARMNCGIHSAASGGEEVTTQNAAGAEAAYRDQCRAGQQRPIQFAPPKWETASRTTHHGHRGHGGGAGRQARRPGLTVGTGAGAGGPTEHPAPTRFQPGPVRRVG